MFTLILALGCTVGSDSPEDSGDTGDTGPESYPSAYTHGKYRATALAIETDETVGADLTGDGAVNNKLPGVLAFVNIFVEADISPDTLNETVVEQIATGEMQLLLEGDYSAGTVTLDILLGTSDEEGALTGIDPLSFAESGDPWSRLNGIFLDETTIEATAPAVRLPFPIISGEAAVLIPLSLVGLDAQLSADGTSGMLTGAVPVDALVDDVVEKIVPTGEDYDEDTYKMPRPEFIEYVRDIGNGEDVSDIILEDGSRAVSAAVSFSADPADW